MGKKPDEGSPGQLPIGRRIGDGARCRHLPDTDGFTHIREARRSRCAPSCASVAASRARALPPPCAALPALAAARCASVPAHPSDASCWHLMAMCEPRVRLLSPPPQKPYTLFLYIRPPRQQTKHPPNRGLGARLFLPIPFPFCKPLFFYVPPLSPLGARLPRSRGGLRHSSARWAHRLRSPAGRGAPARRP